ncbi:MAG: hypothetical protein L6V95_03540 [Candidatus Melainabacteria bacterium]|nr:MAG: hypothetical protein L6V95_03540 [Candidatus Melainabacteria bacterium]
MYDLILNFALNDEEIETKYEICSQLFTLIKPQLSANNKRYEDGKKGGRPKKIKTGGFSEKKPNVNENVNENENVNVNVNEMQKKRKKKKLNIFKITTGCKQNKIHILVKMSKNSKLVTKLILKLNRF